MPFNEIVKSVRAELYDRTVSPLMGSFLLSWLAFNHKLILAFFADVELIEKYRIIDDLIYSNLFEIALNNPILMLFIYPSTMALIYIYVYPILALPVFEHARKNQKKLNDKKKEIDGDTLLSREDSLKMWNEIDIREEQHLKEMARKDRQIEQLKTQQQKPVKNAKNMAPTKKSKTTPSSSNSNKVEKLSKEELKILEYIGAEKTYLSDVLSLTKDSVKSKYLINKLVKKGYLKSDSIYVRNTEKGIEFLVENS